MITRILEFLRPRPLNWSAAEMVLMRIGLAVLIYFLGVHWNLAPFTPDPSKLNGFARIVPLTWILDPSVLMVLRVLTVLGLGCFIAGIAPSISLLPVLLTVCGTGALRNSKGDITHSSQALAMALVAIWIAYLVTGILWKKWKKAPPAAHRAALLAAILIFSASYVASGIVKLKASKGEWISRVPSMAVQMVKANLSDYYSKPEGDINKTMTETAPVFLTEHPTLSKCLFGSGLILELGAFVLLLSRRWAAIWGGALLAMHLAISWLMDIEFWGHIGLLAVLCVMPAMIAMMTKRSTEDSELTDDPLTGPS